MSKEKWLAEARRWAEHIWCYGDLVSDYPEIFEQAFAEGSDPYGVVEAVGEDYGLDRADQNWGINDGKQFVKLWERPA